MDPFCGCCRPRRNLANIRQYVSELTGLTRVQTLLLEQRYVRLVDEYERRSLLYDWIYGTIRMILTLGGALVPALLAIQYIEVTSGDRKITSLEFAVFWAAWTLSVVVCICTGLNAVFKIDRRYYVLHTALEVMQSEIHQFFGLTGKYARIGRNRRPASHHAQIQFLFYSLEKLRLSQIQQEYVQFMESGSERGHRSDDTSPERVATHNVLATALASLIPPGSPVMSPSSLGPDSPAQLPLQLIATQGQTSAEPVAPTVRYETIFPHASRDFVESTPPPQQTQAIVVQQDRNPLQLANIVSGNASDQILHSISLGQEMSSPVVTATATSTASVAIETIRANSLKRIDTTEELVDDDHSHSGSAESNISDTIDTNEHRLGTFSGIQ